MRLASSRNCGRSYCPLQLRASSDLLMYPGFLSGEYMSQILLFSRFYK